jgi:hypothetical protein
LSDDDEVLRCARCGAELKAFDARIYLVVPVLLGALAWLAVRFLGQELGQSGLILVVTVPFGGFLLVLWRASLAAVKTPVCARCPSTSEGPDRKDT